MARKRLNVKFLVVLVSVAGLLLVGLAVAGWWYKESPGRAIRRAEEAEERGDWEKAAEQWAKAARASNDAEFLLKAIDASLKRTSEEGGRELLQQINQNYTALLVSDPGLLPALRGQMRLLAGDRAFGGTRPTAATREVRRLAGEILKQEPADSEAKTLRALATINLAQFTSENIPPAEVEQAELELQSVAEVGPGDGLAVANMVQRMLSRADQSRAAGDIDAALEQWQAAVKFIDDVVARHGKLSDPPTLQEARLQWRFGQSYGMAARMKPALDAVKLSSGGTAVADIDAEQLMNDPVTVAVTQKSHDHIAAAHAALDEQRDLLEEDYREIYMAWADSLVSQGKAQDAEAGIRKLLEQRPWDTQVSATLARMLQQQNRLEEAVEVVREARRREAEPLPQLQGHAGVNAQINRMLLKPFEAEVLLSRHDTTSDPEQRKALLAEAKAIYEEYEGQRMAIGYPALSESTRIAGHIQILEGDLAGGIQTLTGALRFTTELRTQADRRERLKVLGMLVDANRRLGQTGAQRRYLEEMNELAPGVTRLGRDLVEVYLAQGETARARELVKRLLAQSPDDPALQELALRATPAEERDAAYTQLPESTQAQRQAKLSAALRLGNGEEAIRLGNAMREALPAAEAERSAEEQQLYEGLTLTVAQQLGRLNRNDEAIAMVRPLAEKSSTAKALLTQLEGGTDALVESLPEGANKLMVEAQLAELRGENALALSKLEEAHAAAPDNDTIGNRLFSAYLGRERLDKAEEISRILSARGADQMNGGTYAVRLALARGDIDAAVRASTELAKNYPQFAEALALHGEALRQANRHAEALDSFRRSLDLAPNTPATLIAILTTLEAAGRFQEARPFIDAGLRLQPDNATFHDADQIFQIRFGDPSQVIATRQRAVDNDPESDKARWELGQTLVFAANAATRVGEEVRGRQHMQQALAVFAEAAKKFPSDVRFVQGLVRAALDLGPEAMAIAEPLVEANVVAPEAPLARNIGAVAVAADFLNRQGNLPKAESVVRTALSEPSLTRDQKVSLLQMLSELLVNQNRLDDAIAVLAGYEDVPTVLQRKVEILARRVAAEPQNASSYQAMRQASDAALQDQTLPAGAIPSIAYAEMQRGDLARAVTLLDQALARQASNPRALLLRGAVEARREGGDMDRAAQWLEQASRLMPDDPDTLRELGRIQRRRGFPDEAIAALTHLVELQPQSVATRMELLNLLLSLNPPRFADANRQFRDAEREGMADDPMLLMARAQMEQLRGRVEDGLPFARRSIERSREAGVNLAPEQRTELLQAYLDLLTAARSYEEILQATQPLLAEQEVAWWVHRARAEALAGLKRTDEAIASYKLAVARAQPLGMDDAVLVDMSRNVGFEQSYALIKDRVEPTDGSKPAPRDLLIASSLYAQEGRMDKAISLLEEAVAREADLTPEQRVSLDTQLGTIFLVISPRNLERAIFHLRRAADMQPENIGVLNNFAYALTLQSEEAGGEEGAKLLGEAVEISRRAYDLNQGLARRLNRDPSPTVLDTYGWALALTGLSLNDPARQEEALRLLREARGLAEDANSDLPEIYLHLSRLLAATGNGQMAQEAAEAGLARLDRRKLSTEPLEAHLEADLRAALMRARDQATMVDSPASRGG